MEVECAVCGKLLYLRMDRDGNPSCVQPCICQLQQEQERAEKAERERDELLKRFNEVIDWITSTVTMSDARQER